jgi:hypothetical protein
MNVRLDGPKGPQRVDHRGSGGELLLVGPERGHAGVA